VGDTAGVMSYSNGQSNVFVDLTSVAGSTGQAAVTDTLNTGGETTMAVDIWARIPMERAPLNRNNYVGTALTTLTPPADDQRDQWRWPGLDGQLYHGCGGRDAGATALTDTGIEISGSVGSGVNPTSGSYTGTLSLAGAADGDTLTGSITLQDGTNLRPRSPWAK